MKKRLIYMLFSATLALTTSSAFAFVTKPFGYIQNRTSDYQLIAVSHKASWGLAIIPVTKVIGPEQEGKIQIVIEGLPSPNQSASINYLLEKKVYGQWLPVGSVIAEYNGEFSSNVSWNFDRKPVLFLTHKDNIQLVNTDQA